MVRKAVVAVVMLLAGCANAAEKAQDRYEMAKRADADEAELCRLSGEVAQAWLHEGDEEEYKMAKLRRDLDCNAAALCRLAPSAC